LCINFFSDHPVCNEITTIKGTNFPSNKFNVVFHAEHKNLTEEFVIVNHRVVFIDKNQTACIWWHETGFWWIGHCRNVGQNLGEYFWENSEGCPDGKKKIWFSKLDSNNNATTTNGHLLRGRRRQIKLRNVSVGPRSSLRMAMAHSEKSQSSTANLGYIQVKSGKHKRMCVWRHTRSGIRCIKRSTVQSRLPLPLGFF